MYTYSTYTYIIAQTHICVCIYTYIHIHTFAYARKHTNTRTKLHTRRIVTWGHSDVANFGIVFDVQARDLDIVVRKIHAACMSFDGPFIYTVWTTEGSWRYVSCVYVCVRVCMYVCVCVCMCACVYVCCLDS